VYCKYSGFDVARTINTRQWISEDH